MPELSQARATAFDLTFDKDMMAILVGGLEVNFNYIKSTEVSKLLSVVI